MEAGSFFTRSGLNHVRIMLKGRRMEKCLRANVLNFHTRHSITSENEAKLARPCVCCLFISADLDPNDSQDYCRAI